MQTNIQICAYVSDQALCDRVARICAAQGWTVSLKGVEDARPPALSFVADIVVFDRIELLPAIAELLDAQQNTHAVYLGEAQETDLPPRCIALRQAPEQGLVYAITTTLNISRFESQFFREQQAEPITKLPHHPELLAFMARFTGEPTGLIVVQIDHAEHLYANLDPVSKTDLLGALSDHLHRCLPNSTHMGIYDAASFAVWCPGMSATDLDATAHELCAQGRASLHFRGGQLHFTLSAGVAFTATLTNPQLLWQQAWAAKEQVKSTGGDGVAGASLEADIGKRIPGALSRDEFGLVLQPQWDIQSTAIKGVESLLRWEGMEVGNIAPDRFIPIAERNGQMARVGDWVLERACCEAATWLEHLIAPIVLGINVSPQQFVNDAIKVQIERLSKDQWLDPAILELELSHDNLLHVVDQQRTTLFQLRDMGVRIAIDNLGIGVVDTNKLLRCPADTLKIDRSLVAKIEQDPGARTLIEQICQVGQRFDLRTVAVGVENDTQRQLLEDFGCTDAQGYLVSAPVPLAAFQEYLANAQHDDLRKQKVVR